MKRTFAFISILVFLLCSCGKEEPKLELFSLDAFAYDLDSGWEVNATVNAKGIKQIEAGEKYEHKLSYSVFLVTPEQDTLKEIDRGEVGNLTKEEVLDIPLESQIELDSTFGKGNYKLGFIVKDLYSNQIDTIAAAFKLGFE